MAYYRECPTCGAHLDPGERCMECAAGGGFRYSRNAHSMSTCSPSKEMRRISAEIICRFSS